MHYAGFLSHKEWEQVIRDSMVVAAESSTTYNSFSMDGVIKSLVKTLTLRFNVERLKLAHGMHRIAQALTTHLSSIALGCGSSKLATKAVEVGDTLTAVVCNGTVQYLVNGELQAELRPTCARPWRFAWFATSSASASVTQLSH